MGGVKTGQEVKLHQHVQTASTTANAPVSPHARATTPAASKLQALLQLQSVLVVSGALGNCNCSPRGAASEYSGRLANQDLHLQKKQQEQQRQQPQQLLLELTEYFKKNRTSSCKLYFSLRTHTYFSSCHGSAPWAIAVDAGLQEPPQNAS